MTDPEYDEKRLLAAVRSSDVSAFKVLFEKYQPMLFRSLAGRLRDEEMAHDIVQETFVRVWERRSYLRPHLPFFPYIYRIGTNLLKDQMKHARTRARHTDDAAQALYPRDPTTEDQFVARELEELVHTIVHEELGERCRMIFLMSRAGGKSNREIADMLQISLKTVENQLTHALEVLRNRLRMVQ